MPGQHRASSSTQSPVVVPTTSVSLQQSPDPSPVNGVDMMNDFHDNVLARIAHGASGSEATQERLERLTKEIDRLVGIFKGTTNPAMTVTTPETVTFPATARDQAATGDQTAAEDKAAVADPTKGI
ncbi:hypothetical protein QBC39DRAFT_369648 [Podospora conica]|nr:hypothetical protein QBC39DRAFT_369648 [Schizothecium conicum]